VVFDEVDQFLMKKWEYDGRMYQSFVVVISARAMRSAVLIGHTLWCESCHAHAPCYTVCTTSNTVPFRVSNHNDNSPIPVAERSKAWICSLSPAGIVGSNPARGMDVCLLCVCQVEVSATG
jgi:hypothetical protein